ncbi:hypothetical protein [Burkholderia phage BCSR129]|nr:hypothetical protein [Burkholderia phage BCSR129]
MTIKRAGLAAVGMSVVLGVIAVIGAVTDYNKSRNEKIAEAVASNSAAAVSVLQDTGKWLYRISDGDKEDIDPKPYATALIVSENKIDVKGFGEGSWDAGMTLNNFGGEKAVFFMTKGHFMDCKNGVCKVRVRFDSGPITEYSGTALTDLGFGAVALTRADEFIEATAKAHEVKIETRYFKAGPKTYTFDVRGFDPKKLVVPAK